jgi:hypothetical protein
MNLRNRVIDLSKRGEVHQDNYCRPHIRFSIDTEPYNGDCYISLTLQEQMGQPTRYIELSKEDALLIGRQLISMANNVNTLVREAREEDERSEDEADRKLEEIRDGQG